MPVIHKQPYAKPVCAIGKHERLIDPSSLTAHQKQVLWLGIKILDPNLADLLKTDSTIKGLQTTFNARVQFEAEMFNRYVQAGQQALELKHHEERP